MATISSGYIYVQARDAHEAVCRAHLAKMGFFHDDFWITDINPALAQVFTRGRYDFGLTQAGDWRVFVTAKSNVERVPDEVLAALKTHDWFLDLRVYAEGMVLEEVA